MKIGVWRTYCGSHVVGKHWGNSSSEQSARARTIAVRCVSGGLCLSLAVLAFGGFQGLSAFATYGAPTAVPTAAMPPVGDVGPEALDPLAHSAVTAPAGTPGTVTADAQALVAFSRSTVDTATREGVRGELNVASAALSRPRAGFPHGSAGIAGAIVPVRAAHQPPDGIRGRIPLGPGLCGPVRHPRLLRRRRCGAGRWVAPVGRRKPGGNRPRQRSHHHVQPSGGDRGQEGRLGTGGGSYCPGRYHRIFHRLPPSLRNHPQRLPH